MQSAGTVRSLAFVLLWAPFAAGAEVDARQDALDRGDELSATGQYQEAIRAYREADHVAPGGCAECQLGLARAFNALGATKDARKAAEASLALAKDDKARAVARHELGFALLREAGSNAAKLAAAEAEFRQALELTGGAFNTARYHLAGVLLRQSRDAEGVALLKEYLAREPNSPHADDARELIANPLRGRKAMMPDFGLVTLAGEYLTPEDLEGKVVLFDFWATWCAPCVASIPELRTLARRWADEPFVLISVSADQDEKTVRDFVESHEMPWTVIWDKRSEFSRRCHVSGLPSYMLVDASGEILYLISGLTPATSSDISVRINKALKELRRKGKG